MFVCHSIGQKKPVHVYQLIAENTVESKVLDIQEKKKQLIKEVCITYLSLFVLPHLLFLQAFSGMKNKETQRQKKQARLQGAYLNGSSANGFAYFEQQTLYKSSASETQELPLRKAIDACRVSYEAFSCCRLF